MLKHSVFLLIFASLVCALPLSAVAQDAGPGGQKSRSAGGPPGHRHFDPAKRAERLGKELSLSPDQKAKVEDILKSEQSQIEKLRADSPVSKEDRHSKMMDIHKTSGDEIRALLNSDQQKKWDAIQEKRHKHMGRHHRGAQQPGVPPPPSEEPK
jgi:periplasmic protein CpxP/Spy